MATYIRVGNGSIERVNYSDFCFSSRVDSPYNTPTVTFVNDQTFSPGYQYGKAIDVSNTLIARRRAGFSFPLSSSYRGGAQFRIVLNTKLFINTLESFSPQVYASNTNDAALYNPANTVWTWEANLNNNLGLMTYGVTGEQTLSIDPAIITPLLGSKLSIIAGIDTDFANGGVTSGANKNAVFQIADNGVRFNARLEIY